MLKTNAGAPRLRALLLAALLPLAGTGANAQAPLSAVVLASQPNRVVKALTREQCSDYQWANPKADAADDSRLYMGVGAVLGGAVLALATQNLSAGAQLAATGVGVLAGGYAGKKLAERKSNKPVWSFDEPAPKEPVVALAPEAREARQCVTVESTQEVQEGYLNMLRVRGEDMVVRTDNPLRQGSTIRVYINPRGEMELLN